LATGAGALGDTGCGCCEGEEGQGEAGDVHFWFEGVVIRAEVEIGVWLMEEGLSLRGNVLKYKGVETVSWASYKMLN
jgi:hypothetical protein